MTSLQKSNPLLPPEVMDVLNGIREGVDRHERIHIVLKFLKERGCSEALFTKVLNMCGDPECSDCGELVCPAGEPLHFHHDGCPACSSFDVQKISRNEAMAIANADAKYEAEQRQIDDEIWRSLSGQVGNT